MEEVSRLKNAITELEQIDRELSAKLEESLSELPNYLAEDVPEGNSDLDNIELRSEGIIKPRLFQPKDHVELGEKLEEIDFDSAIKISGARFVVLRGTISAPGKGIS